MTSHERPETQTGAEISPEWQQTLGEFAIEAAGHTRGSLPLREQIDAARRGLEEGDELTIAYLLGARYPQEVEAVLADPQVKDLLERLGKKS